MIDVVNEATPSHQPAAFARNAFGNDWIIRSFQLARQYCPNAVLILNDYNVLSWDTDAFIQLATPVVASGFVDALGEQAHGLESWSLNDIQTRLNRVAALGLPIYITEYDVARTNDQEQLSIMQTQFPLFYNHPSVEGITLWGYVVGVHLGEWQRVDSKQRHTSSGDDVAEELHRPLNDRALLYGGAPFFARRHSGLKAEREYRDRGDRCHGDHVLHDAGGAGAAAHQHARQQRSGDRPHAADGDAGARARAADGLLIVGRRDTVQRIVGAEQAEADCAAQGQDHTRGYPRRSTGTALRSAAGTPGSAASESETGPPACQTPARPRRCRS